MTAITELRYDIGADATSLPDPDAQELLDRAAALYPDAATASAYARVLALNGMLASAARLTDYKQNSSSESRSQVFKNLKDLLKLWEDKVAEAEKASIGAVGSGRTTRKPRRVREFPGW